MSSASNGIDWASTWSTWTSLNTYSFSDGDVSCDNINGRGHDEFYQQQRPMDVVFPIDKAARITATWQKDSCTTLRNFSHIQCWLRTLIMKQCQISVNCLRESAIFWLQGTVAWCAFQFGHRGLLTVSIMAYKFSSRLVYDSRRATDHLSTKQVQEQIFSLFHQ